MTSNTENSTAESSPLDAAFELYRQRAGDYAKQVADSEQTLSNFGWMRGLSFFGAVLLGVFGLTNVIPGTIGLTLAAVTFLAFLVITFVHENADRRLAMLRLRQRINVQAELRLARDWENADLPAVKIEAEYDAISKDLDLFGKASLYQLVCIAKTPDGRGRLAKWFLDSPEVGEILKRQQAVKQLAPQFLLREELQVYGSAIRASKTGPSDLIDWAERDSWLDSRRPLRIVATVLASLMFIALLLLITGWIVPRQVSATAVMVLMGVHFVVSIFTSGSIHWIFRQVATRSSQVENYQRLFELSRQIDGDSPMLTSIRETLTAGEANASTEMGRLQRVMSFANMRSSGLLFIVYLIMQFLFLWDVHILGWLEAWQRRNSKNVRGWFEAVGNWESLASLSQIAHDHPHWAWPTIVDAKDTTEMSAETIGHPLLDEETSVSNDVRLGPTGKVLLVTGSNMSGKSTLLRSIGINATLAQAGSVVCASSMSMPLVRIETSMRISDSLASGVSFFMAELKRLKEIVDNASTYNEQSSHTLLYLLDEILQGTNSTERHIAVQRVLRHLLDSRAIGAISTHDLDLAAAPGITERMLPVYFRETFSDGPDGRQMTFDYQMREGVAPTTNALKLLELVGLNE